MAGRRHKKGKGWEEEGIKKERKKEFRGKGGKKKKKKSLLLALNWSG